MYGELQRYGVTKSDWKPFMQGNFNRQAAPTYADDDTAASGTSPRKQPASRHPSAPSNKRPTLPQLLPKSSKKQPTSPHLHPKLTSAALRSNTTK